MRDIDNQAVLAMMDFVDVLRRCLPVVGPLTLFVAVAHIYRHKHSALLLVCAVSLAMTLVASVLAAWLGLHFDESHELPDWYNRVYWWSTQWIAPLGYAVAGLSFLAFSLRNRSMRGVSE